MIMCIVRMDVCAINTERIRSTSCPAFCSTSMADRPIADKSRLENQCFGPVLSIGFSLLQVIFNPVTVLLCNFSARGKSASEANTDERVLVKAGNSLEADVPVHVCQPIEEGIVRIGR